MGTSERHDELHVHPDNYNLAEILMNKAFGTWAQGYIKRGGPRYSVQIIRNRRVPKNKIVMIAPDADWCGGPKVEEMDISEYVALITN